MNPKEIIDIKNNITNIIISMEDINKIISSLKIDNQKTLKSNKIIPPGISCKVAYDSNGLIIQGEKLEIDDIPDLPIEKITGLMKLINTKLESQNLKTTESFGSNREKVRKNIRCGSGIKFDYENDIMFISSDLSSIDIPDLPIEKITGLCDKLSFLESQIITTINEEIVKEKSINPGTYPKITYNADGKVLSGSQLSIDDIPIELITQMNKLECRIPLLAAQLSVDSLIKEVKNKVNSNGIIKPGVYTKIEFDSQGLAISGDNITINDLPEINIQDINNLESALRKKADQKDFIELSNTISSIINNNQSSELMKIKNQLNRKASSDDIKDISIQLGRVQKIIDTISSRIPTEYITEQLQQIQNTISTLSGRITVIENKMNIEDFCKILERN